MAITNTDKLVTKEVLEYYQQKVDDKYIDAAELASATEDFITDDALDGYAQTKDVVTKAGMDEDLKDYAKSATVESTYVKKDGDKVLSTYDYDKTAKDIVDGLETTLNGYVQKEGSKVLSDNNFSTEYKNQLDAIDDTYASKQSVAELISSGVIYKGDVENLTALNALTATAKNGHMYNVKETDMNYVFNGTSWDPYSAMVDISGKADKTDFVKMTTAEVDAMMQG